ncbi:MAG: Transcription initiation factor subunit [Nocardia sp.]|uniref:hypothetical protein n=1 Tax=Nocardia sp. TaxID=1821 RepID=UPI00262AFB0A|nr:hypothetical protein [Nocardia sp.]MCU1647981.1 Transcription initiation factor subunit [Nocardia sp.]
MTRDLPFDDAPGVGGDDAGDTAYRIADGVARVARAGAYVTGGALIASAGTRGGGPTPAIDHDSRNVGWSQVDDPQPNVPSPTLTFPDLTLDRMPPVHGGYGGIAPVAAPEQQFGTDAGLLPTHFDASSLPDPTMAGFHGMGLPDTDLPASFALPSTHDYQPQSGFELPTDGQSPGLPFGTQPGVPLDDQQFQIPGGFHLPDFDGLHLPGLSGDATHGFDGLHLPGTPGGGFGQPGGGFGPHGSGEGFGHDSGEGFGEGSHGGIFDGIGNGPVGVYVSTDWAVNMHLGLDGVQFESDLKVDVAVGNVGHQLDQFTQDMGQGISHIPAGLPGTPVDPNNPFTSAAGLTGSPNSATNPAGQQANSQAVAGAGPTSGLPGSPVGTAGSPGLGAAGSPGVGAAGAPGVGAVGAPTAAPAYSAPSAPAFAPAVPAPAAPMPAAVAPMAIAPIVPVAPAPAFTLPVAVAQPVVTTPLQTTIQPDAATHPIANLLTTPGQSPLTASAANAPGLFNHAGPVLLASGVHGDSEHPVSVIAQPVPLTSAPGGSVPQISVPVKPVPVLTTAPTIPSITKLPAIDPVTKVPVITTVPTVPTTSNPPVTVAPVTPDPDSDTTTRPHNPSGDNDTHGDVPPVTVPSDTDSAPTHQPPVTHPSQPTVPTTQPDLPTHGGQPSISVDPPVPVMPGAVQPPTTQPHVPDVPHPAKPAGDPIDSSLHVMPIADDSALHSVFLMHDGGLTTGLMPTDTSFADTHYQVHGPFDHALL